MSSRFHLIGCHVPCQPSWALWAEGQLGAIGHLLCLQIRVHTTLRPLHSFPLTRGSGIWFVILSFISQRWVRPPWLLGQIEWKGRMLEIQHIVCLFFFFFLSQTLWIRRSAQNFCRMNKQKDTWMESEVLVDQLAQP